ncbi:MAG: hypothetical protein ACRDKW_10975, partial [Actinomycetota bacterium]
TMKTVVAALTLLLALASTASAELSRDDKKRANAMLKGTLYTRVDMPCQTGRHPFGVYHAALVEVSPTGAAGEVTEAINYGWYNADSTDWSVRINEAVVVDEAEFDGTTVEIALEGTGSSEGRDTSINFVQIATFADFEAAFNQAFSRQPLQDEHPDWPSEVRQAIARRELAEGMTKRQAYYVVGDPESSETRQEDGKEVEIWTLRTQGLQFGFWGARVEETGNPGSLRFVDGKLTVQTVKQPGSKVVLD